MGIPVLVRRHLYIMKAPCLFSVVNTIDDDDDDDDDDDECCLNIKMPYQHV